MILFCCSDFIGCVSNMEHGIAIKCALGMNSRVLFLNMNFDTVRVDQSLIGLL